MATQNGTMMSDSERARLQKISQEMREVMLTIVDRTENNEAERLDKLIKEAEMEMRATQLK